MHYVTGRSHQMQKHKCGVTCPDALFTKTTPGPPKHKILCVDISRPGCIGMHYLTRRSYQMQKHKLGIMCPGVDFMETTPGPPEHEK
jgi:hypothetical protein